MARLSPKELHEKLPLQEFIYRMRIRMKNQRICITDEEKIIDPTLVEIEKYHYRFNDVPEYEWELVAPKLDFC